MVMVMVRVKVKVEVRVRVRVGLGFRVRVVSVGLTVRGRAKFRTMHRISLWMPRGGVEGFLGLEVWWVWPESGPARVSKSVMCDPTWRQAAAD